MKQVDNAEKNIDVSIRYIKEDLSNYEPILRHGNGTKFGYMCLEGDFYIRYYGDGEWHIFKFAFPGDHGKEWELTSGTMFDILSNAVTADVKYLIDEKVEDLLLS